MQFETQRRRERKGESVGRTLYPLRHLVPVAGLARACRFISRFGDSPMALTLVF